MGGDYGWLGMILNLVINLIVIIGSVLLVVWFVRRILPAAGIAVTMAGSSPTVKEALQARYARGEITREHYKKMLSDLS